MQLNTKIYTKEFEYKTFIIFQKKSRK